MQQICRHTGLHPEVPLSDDKLVESAKVNFSFCDRLNISIGRSIMQFKFGVVDIAPTLATDEAIRGVYRLPYHPPLSNFLPSLSMLSTVNRWSNTIEVDMVVIERGVHEENILCHLP